MAEQPDTQEEPGGGQARHPPVMLLDHFLIDPNAPLPELNTPSAKAYEVEDRRDLNSKLFALVCSHGLPARTGVMFSLRGKNFDGLIPLVEWAAVDWPPIGKRATLVIYQRPLGGRVVDVFNSGKAKLSEYDMAKQIIGPLTEGLNELAKLRVSHRAIRPDNIFFMDKERQNIVLGDCTAAPPGFDQPLTCETIERAMASPGGRGVGSVSDDLFALGAAIVLSLPGKNKVTGMEEDELINSRIEHGSYATLCSGARVPMSLLELVRGLINDDEEERWGIDDIRNWVLGKPYVSIKKRPARKAETPITFSGSNHYNARSLARLLTLNVTGAAKFIKEGQLELWLRQSLQEEAMADAVDALVRVAKVHQNDPLGSKDFIVTKTSIILDPAAPIRYKGFSFMADAYGPALAIQYLGKGDIQPAIEVVMLEIPSIWVKTQPRSSPETANLERSFAALRRHLQDTTPGYGVERCLYELNPGLPCQSPLINEMHVVTIDELLPGLDNVSNRVDTKKSPLDRHVTGFIAARFDQEIKPHLKALGSDSEETAIIGMLSLLAFLQWQLGLVSLLGLSSWVGGLLGPAINTYHSRTTRREIERKIPRLVRQGSLPDIFDLIDSSDKRQQDSDGYEAAIEEFVTAEKEIQEIESGGTTNQEKTEKAGQQAAAMTSVILTMIIVTILFMLEMI
ncbi:MAG: protein kinase family protein [Rhodospirillales bacterium]